MARKLRVELEVDTTKAKKQVASAVEQSGGSGGKPGASISTASPAMERTARNLRNLGDAAEGANVNLKSAGKAFAGMAIGLATSYAAGHMKEGAGRTAVEYGGGILGGASAGMMFGPLGALIGGVGGAAATYFKRDEAQQAATKDFQKYNDNYQDGRLWAKQIRDLTDVEPSAVGLSKTDAYKDQREKAEAKMTKAKELALAIFDEELKIETSIRNHLKNNELEAAEEERAKLETKRARREQAESIQRAYDKQIKALDRAEEERLANAKETRTSMAGTDALAKAGAGWGAAQSSAAAAETSSSARPSGSAIVGFSVAARKTSEMRFGESDETPRAIKAANDIIKQQNARMIELLADIDRQFINKGDTWQ